MVLRKVRTKIDLSSQRALFAASLGLASVALGCADVDGELDGTSSSVESISLADTYALDIKLDEGEIHGKLVGNTREFLGIPYAEAPVGDLRFAPPVPVANWDGVRDATAFGPSCPQNPGGLAAPGPQSEDCLLLNVFAPQGNKSKLPVMVFIHGGAFVAGGSVSYDGRKLSEEGQVVVVTINYRLGALGLLSHPALDAEEGAVSGNNMFRDQQLALEWVRKNIKRFGGEAHAVTLFGESAGAWSTCINMVSPTGKNLAARYIMQSGTCVAGMAISTQAQAQAVGTELANTLCAGESDQLACLRAAPASAVIAFGATRGITGAGWAPVVSPGNDVLPAHPSDIIASGALKKTDIIVGSNAREWGLFQAIGASPRMTSLAQYHATLDATFGPQLSPALKFAVYPATDATANSQFVKLMSDYLFRCPARELARQVTATGNMSAHLYSFEEGLAFHAFELPYVFGNPNPALGAPLLVEPLRKTVQTYWTKFAAKGDPNAHGQPNWPVYSTATEQHMTLKAASAVGSNLSKAECDFWASLPRI
jgi:para-nitrobenzyl esterase